VRTSLTATEAQGRITAIDVELILEGAFDEDQLPKLAAAAETCRISRALAVPITQRVRALG
jgi:uncharacterized OsmC-like protein